MKWRHYLLALLIVAIASAIRLLLFADLGRGTSYLTYYPAVMLAALFGGLYPGLLAMSVSALLSFYWLQHGYMNRVETLAMVAFVISCAMISGIAEAMRRAEARAEQEKDRAEAANMAKSAFLARMSHELRTPLNAILGFTEIMRRDAGISQSWRTNLDIINRSGEHLLSLINDVLDMAKIDAGRVAVEVTTFNIRDMVRETTDLLRLRAEEKGLDLVLDLLPDFPPVVRADTTKLRQIIINLVGNAIKYTEQGGVTLRLDAIHGDAPPSAQLIIEVSDSGIGIAEDDQKRIFDPFVQAGEAQRQKGTGLGLAITHKFVELLGGQMSLHSQVGKGSVFRVKIPVERAAATDVPTPAQAGRIIGLAPGEPDYRVLIVEDQMENWKLLQQLLEPVGFQVRIAENGLAGVEMFQAWRPDFIWMDIRMPVLDGLEAAQRIRALDGGKEVKIVAVTASVFKEELDLVRVAGMDDLVRKPFRPEEIYDCMRRHLGVGFIYAGTAANPAAVSVAPLRPEALANLPERLRGELGAALLTLDATRIAEVIRRIAARDLPLGETLSQAAGQFNYTAILQALKASDASLKSAVS